MGAVIGLLVKDLDLPALVSYWESRAPLVVVSAIGGVSLWNTRLRPLIGAIAASLGALWLWVTFTPFCAWLARDLPRQDRLQTADAVFVLGSDVQLDGELTSEAASRLVHALELLGQGLAPRLIVSELPPPRPSHAEAARKLMKNLGLQQEVLSIGRTYNTRDEAEAVGALFRKHGWKRLLVSTSPTHSRRASAALEREGIEVVSSPSPQTRYDLENLELFALDNRIRAFGDLIHEKVGLWVYARRGWLGGND